MNKLSPKQRKWGKRILIFLALRIVFGAIFFYVVDYRFKNILQLAVKEKSNNTYFFDSGPLDVSIFKKTIVIKNAVFYRKDTINTPTHYKIQVKNLFFRIASFSDLIFHRKLVVDSLALNSPFITLHELKRIDKKQKNIHLENIELVFRQLLKHLSVKSFHIDNASYVFRSKLLPSAFKIHGINLTISNFSSNKDINKHLFATDDIDIRVSGQHVALPDGTHFFDFKDFHFSGKNQYFQLDSFTFLAKAVTGRTETKIYADKIRFKSSQLTSIFTKNELVMDTIKLVRPVLQLGKNSNQLKSENSSKIKYLFKSINFKYIDIEDGSFINNDSTNKAPQYGTNKVDLKLYNLSYSPTKPKSLKADSVKLNLSKIKFTSKDGKVQLTVDEMAIAKNEVILRNAVYAPVHPSANNLTFVAPTLKLKNVNFAALLDKRISADQADLVNPTITVSTKAKVAKQGDTTKVKGFKRFFKMLNSLNELIAVKYFNIQNGKIALVSHAQVKTSVLVDKFNANILLDKLLRSDTTLEFKHAIPTMTFKKLRVASPKMTLQMGDYLFEGRFRHNTASTVEIKTAGGVKIRGKNLYWEWLDWDLYQDYKMIFIDSLRAGAIDISIDKNKNATVSKKSLPKLEVGRLDIRALSFSQKLEKAITNFSGTSIYGQTLKTKGNQLIWARLGGNFKQIAVRSEMMKLNVARANIDAAGNSVIENVLLKTSKNNQTKEINIPALEFKGPFYSSNISTLNLAYVHLKNPEINVEGDADVSSRIKNPFILPLNFNIKELHIQQAKLTKTSFKISDTLRLKADFDLKVSDIFGKKNSKKLLSAKATSLHLNEFSIQNKNLNISAPLTLTSNNLVLNKTLTHLRISGAVNLKANKLNAQYQKDSTNMSVKNTGLNIAYPNLVYEQGKPLQWDLLAAKTTVQHGQLNYQSKTSTINVGNLQWFPKSTTIKLKDFAIKPNLSLENTKLKQPWQSDYIIASAKMMVINSIDLKKLAKTKALQITKVIIDSAKLSTSRDKRMPDKNFAEKLMPTKLLTGIKSALKIDELKFRNGTVYVNETSVGTGLQGTIPLDDINATIYNLTNQVGSSDSLKLTGTARLMGKTKIALNYRESYADSLSGFKMNLQIEPMSLNSLSEISRPFAAVNINSGTTKNIAADWSGNKYFADGTMLFPYEDLNISLLDKHNFERKSFKLFIENKLLNLILHKKNSQPAFIFFERNLNKFVFNYWIKTALSGFASSVGPKRERKLKKKEKAAKAKHHL